MDRLSPAPSLLSFGAEQDAYLSDFLADDWLPSSRSHSPIENPLFYGPQPAFDDVFTSSVAPAAARSLSPSPDSDKENEAPVPLGSAPHLRRRKFIAGAVATREQIIQYRKEAAASEGRDLTIPEQVECRVIFLDDHFEQDLVLWTIRALAFWYMYDPDDAMLDPPDQWWRLTGADYRAFTRRYALPPFAPTTKLVEHMPLPMLPNPDFSVGPRPVRGSPVIEKLLVGLTPRDLAYATAGSTIKPTAGETYAFLDFYPELAHPMSLEDAFIANGFSAAKIQRLLGKAPPLPRPCTPPPPEFPLVLPDSPDFPEYVTSGSSSSPSSSPSAPATPASERWASSSTLCGSSPLPPSDWEEERSPPARNWKTGKRIPGPLGRSRILYREHSRPAAALPVSPSPRRGAGLRYDPVYN